MKSDKRDDLIKICDELEKCRKKKLCRGNEIVCTKGLLKQYIGEDKNKLLKLKALVNIHNFAESDTTLLSFWMAAVSMMISGVGVFSGNEQVEKVVAQIVVGIFVATIILLWITGKLSNKYNYRDKWIKHIEVILDNWDVSTLK